MNKSAASKILFAKEYTDESLYDLSSDIADLLDGQFYHSLPQDKDGFKRGVFHVSIIWKDEK